MRTLLLSILFLSLLPLAVQAQAVAGPPVPPSGFDPKTPAPADLPKELDIPMNTRVEAKAYRLTPLPASSLKDANRLLWAPDLVSAVFERGAGGIHAIYTWEGNRTSEAFVIHGTTFRLATFAYPDQIAASGNALGFYLSREIFISSGGSGGNFPGSSWYKPGDYVGTATLDGKTVLVFAPGESPTDREFPTGISLCLDAKTLLPVYLSDGAFVVILTSSPVENVQIDPQGPYLQAVQNQFGHYP